MQLWTLSHVMQGVVCAAALPGLWWFTRDAAWWDRPGWMMWLIGVAGWYLLGQACLFVVLRRVEASRVSPLLGVKVAVLAGAAVGLLGVELSAVQWVGVGLAAGAAWVLNGGAERLPWRVLGLVGVTLVGYVGSDLSIQSMVDAQQSASGAAGVTRDDLARDALMGGVVGALCSYVVSGMVAAGCLPWWGSRRGGDWAAAVPYAGLWLASMLTLFTCIASVGVVLANILQSTRGLWSVVLGVVVSGRGHHHVEATASRAVVARRGVWAVLMVAAVALYVLGRSAGR